MISNENMEYGICRQFMSAWLEPGSGSPDHSEDEPARRRVGDSALESLPYWYLFMDAASAKGDLLVGGWKTRTTVL
jgi:hypothetical protein